MASLVALRFENTARHGTTQHNTSRALLYELNGCMLVLACCLMGTSWRGPYFQGLCWDEVNTTWMGVVVIFHLRVRRLGWHACCPRCVRKPSKNHCFASKFEPLSKPFMTVGGLRTEQVTSHLFPVSKDARFQKVSGRIAGRIPVNINATASLLQGQRCTTGALRDSSYGAFSSLDKSPFKNGTPIANNLITGSR